MKYLYFIFIILSSVFGVSDALGQCTTNTYGAYGTPAPTCGSGSYGAWASVTWAYSREYSIVNVTAGNTYQFQSYVTSNNGSRFTTITTTANVALSWGTTSDNNSVTWVATFTGQVRFWTHRNQGCGASTVNQTRRVRCNVPPCTGTEITLTMDDSYGDGWNGANLTITGDGGSTYGPFTLPNGSTGTETICLPDDCYSINVTGGTWPGEVSWTLTDGGTTLASGGAPVVLSEAFSTGAANCAPPCPTPTNDLCANAPLLDLGSNNNQTYSGTGCGSTATLGTDQDVWVAFEVPCGGMDVVIDFCGSNPVHDASYINIFDDCSFATFTQANSWDFTTCSDGNISLFWNNLPEGIYYFPVYIDPSWQTDFELNISGTPISTLASAPTGISGNNNICAGENTTLTIQGGSPGTSGSPEWFSGSCGSGIIGTGNTINISPQSTTTYFVRYNGNCNTTSCASVTINVDQPNIAPTISGSGTYCLGEQVTLTSTGGNIPTGQFSWFENAVTNPSIGTGGSITVSPNGTTDYIVEVPANGACAAASSNTITVTVPTPDNTLSVNNSQSTCMVNQNGYIHFLDPNGKLIASINSNGQNLGNVTATSYVEAAPIQVQDCASSILTSVLDRHWVITPQFQPTGPVEVVLPMEQNEEQSLVTNANSNSNPDDDLVGLTDIVLTKYAGPANIDNDFQNNCFSQGGNETLDLFTQGMSGFVYDYWPSYNGNDLYASYDINSFSEFWLHGSSNLSPLPVSLTSFNANCQSDNFTEVTWETASEMNASHFIVERSRDGLSWSNEHEVDAAGNANTLNSYSFEDHNAGIGFEGYYRLRQVDFDGEETLYGPISVQCDEIKNASMEVFPNPSSGSFTLRIFNNIEVEDAKIVILDVNGKVIQQDKTNINNGITTLLYDQKQLVKGMYYIRVIADGVDMAPKKLVIN